MLSLYLLTQSANTGDNTYSGAIVCAESEEQAREIIPSPFYKFFNGRFFFQYKNKKQGDEGPNGDPTWTNPKNVSVIRISSDVHKMYKAGEVVLADFNKGFDESRYLDLRRIRSALRSGDLPAQVRQHAEAAEKAITEQMQDEGLNLLRAWLIEANRSLDQKLVKKIEKKLADYLDQPFQDYS